MHQQLRARSGLFAVSAAAMLWGTTGVVVRDLHQHTGLPAVTIGCLRLVASAVVLLPVLVAAGRPAIRGLARHPVLTLATGAGLGVYQALYFIAVTDVGVSIATLVSLGVAPISIIAAKSVKRLPSPGTVVICGCALAGLGLVSLAGGSAGATTAPHPGTGMLAAVGSGLCYAASTVVGQQLGRDVGPGVMTASSSVIGAITLAPFAAASGVRFPVGLRSGGELVYLGAATTALAYALFYLGLRTTVSEVASVLTLIEPLTATVLASLILREHLSAAGWLGTGLLIVAVTALYLRPAESGSGEVGPI